MPKIEGRYTEPHRHTLTRQYLRERLMREHVNNRIEERRKAEAEEKAAKRNRGKEKEYGVGSRNL